MFDTKKRIGVVVHVGLYTTTLISGIIFTTQMGLFAETSMMQTLYFSGIISTTIMALGLISANSSYPNKFYIGYVVAGSMLAFGAFASCVSSEVLQRIVIFFS